MASNKEKEEFEKNWDIFVLTGMPWHEIKELDRTDRDLMYDKAVEAKLRAIELHNINKDEAGRD